ncbi:MAG: hypothetical protein NUW37_15090 [Planctomycetes bacterium]|nr:hypothetical protein [Planctomycetota bacterium]
MNVSTVTEGKDKPEIVRILAEIAEMLEKIGETNTQYRMARLLSVTQVSVWRWREQVHLPHKMHVERINLLHNILTGVHNGNRDACYIFTEISKKDAPKWLALGIEGMLCASGIRWAIQPGKSKGQESA